MKRINLIIKILTTSVFILLFIFILNPVFIKINIVSILVFCIVNISFLLLLRFIYLRVRKITGDRSVAKTEVIVSILFSPYVLYYLWWKDNALLDKYKQ